MWLHGSLAFQQDGLAGHAESQPYAGKCIVKVAQWYNICIAVNTNSGVI